MLLTRRSISLRVNCLGVQVSRWPFTGGGTACDDAGCAVMFERIAEGSDHDELDAEIERTGGHVADDRSALRGRLAQGWEDRNVYQADTTAGVTTDDLTVEEAVSDAKDRR